MQAESKVIRITTVAETSHPKRISFVSFVVAVNSKKSYKELFRNTKNAISATIKNSIMLENIWKRVSEKVSSKLDSSNLLYCILQ